MDAGKTKEIMNNKVGFFLTKPKVLVYGIVIGLEHLSCRRAKGAPSGHA